MIYRFFLVNDGFGLHDVTVRSRIWVKILHVTFHNTHRSHRITYDNN